MKIKEVIEKVLAYHPNMPDYEGCDGYKSGNPEDECTGIVSALVPTVEVIQKTIDLGCNLIITHEPIYYQSPDFPEWKGDFKNQVQAEKEQLLKEHHITVWRDHDHIHVHRPDGIFTGVIKYLGWEEYYRPMDKGMMNYIFELPEMTVREVGKHLIEKLGLNGLRYIGRPDDKIKKVALVGHLYPNSFYPDGLDEKGYYKDLAMDIMKMMEEQGVEAIIPGEIIEWTVLSYIRDGIAQGKTKACFNIGHFNMEELGMRYAKDWLEELVAGEVPVHYVPTQDAFSYI